MTRQRRFCAKTFRSYNEVALPTQCSKIESMQNRQKFWNTTYRAIQWADDEFATSCLKRFRYSEKLEDRRLLAKCVLTCLWSNEVRTTWLNRLRDYKTLQKYIKMYKITVLTLKTRQKNLQHHQVPEHRRKRITQPSWAKKEKVLPKRFELHAPKTEYCKRCHYEKTAL